MTTDVKVTAHCASTKEVEIRVNGKLETTLQDTETYSLVVYDNRVVEIKEVLK